MGITKDLVTDIEGGEDMSEWSLEHQRALLRLQFSRYPEPAALATCGDCAFLGWLGKYDLWVCLGSDFVSVTYGKDADNWADVRSHTDNGSILSAEHAYIIRREAARRGTDVMHWYRYSDGSWDAENYEDAELPRRK